MVSRCFPGGYNVKLYVSRGRLAWWLLAFLCCERIHYYIVGYVFVFVFIYLFIYLLFIVCGGGGGGGFFFLFFIFIYLFFI